MRRMVISASFLVACTDPAWIGELDAGRIDSAIVDAARDSGADANDGALDAGSGGPGDDCSNAIDISMAPGSAPIARLGLDYGNCEGRMAGIRDAVFEFDLPDLPGAGDVIITTNAGGGPHEAELQSACGDSTARIACWGGTAEWMQLFRALSAGRHYLIVSTELTAGTITASIAPAPPP